MESSLDQFSKFSYEKNTLDELFHRSLSLKTSEKFIEFLNFTKKFRQYSLFNNALVYLQNPEVTYYATTNHWGRAFNRWVKPDARPMVILAPMTPVLFVYDMDDTDGAPVPELIEDPFKVEGSIPEEILDKTMVNCNSFRIHIRKKKMSSQHGGTTINAKLMDRGYKRSRDVKATIEINEESNEDTMYATLCHELGHIFLGHLGNDEDEWWPNRKHLSRDQAELEAESTSYLVLSRAGMDSRSAEYISHFISDERDIKNISVELIVKTAGLIERMGKKIIPPKKHKKHKRKS